MFGLFDGMAQGASAPGLGMAQAQNPGLFGDANNFIADNRMSLLNFGLGLMSGNSNSDAFQGGMRGLAVGRQADVAERQNRARQALFATLPENQRLLAQLNPEAFVKAQLEAQAPYTLGEGQARFGANGQIMARGPTSPYTLSSGQTRFGADNTPVATGGVDRTTEQKDYEYYVNQERAAGRQPASFSDWGRMNRQAAVTPLPGQNPESMGNQTFQEAAARGDAERFGNIIQQGIQANRLQGDLNSLQELIGPANTNTLAPLRMRLQGVANSVGINTDSLGRLGDAEAIQSIVQRLAPTLRQPGSGAQSDAELKGFLDSLPGLSRSREGNEIIVRTLSRFSERSQQEAAIANDALAGRISRQEARARLVSLGPTIAPQEMQRIRALSQSAAGNIPSEAVQQLRRSPNPERRRQFDEVFGPGAADRVLREQR
jgi:hypothetical protein